MPPIRQSRIPVKGRLPGTASNLGMLWMRRLQLPQTTLAFVCYSLQRRHRPLTVRLWRAAMPSCTFPRTKTAHCRWRAARLFLCFEQVFHATTVHVFWFHLWHSPNWGKRNHPRYAEVFLGCCPSRTWLRQPSPPGACLLKWS